MAIVTRPNGIVLMAPSATRASLTDLMSRFMSRPVVDMTGIGGQYQFDLTFAPEIAPSAPENAGTAEPAPSLAEAVKQYGLRLEARRAPVETLVVTHVEKVPTEN